jgi:signal transduction histidine kinase/CheY-like chemotaxis protein
LAEQMGSHLTVTRIVINIAQADLGLGAYDKAAAGLARATRLSQKGDAAVYQPQIFATEAELARRRGDFSRAVRLVNQAFDEAGGDRDTITFRDAHDTAYKAYKALGQSGPALEHLEILKRLDDKAASLAASANTALMAARFDYANQNLKIAQLKARDLQRKISYERAHARTVRFVFIAAGGVTIIIIVLLAGGLIVIRRSRNEERAAKDDLAVANTALAKALAAKTEFLATTSHEIRTPLNGILGMTQVMLADDALSTRTRDRLDVVHSAGMTMRALVDDILDVAKIETGNMTIEHAPMDMRAILRDVAAIWRDQAQARGLEFVVAVDDCPVHVMGDAARMRQIVFNLLSNAMKFTERGHIALAASVVEEGEGDRLRVCVSDSGVGIPPDKLDDIFESFRQADASTTRRFGGTGLGLAICRNLARAMNGDILVTSTVGQGTVFTIDLPLIAARGESEKDQPEMERNALLIVDRNPITRCMVRAFLESRTDAIDMAASLPEAVDRVSAGGVAIVLIDEATARSAGDSADQILRDLARAAGSTVETVLLWPGPTAADIAHFTALGIDRVIAKPIAGPALAAELYPFDAMNGAGGKSPDLVTDAA